MHLRIAIEFKVLRGIAFGIQLAQCHQTAAQYRHRPGHRQSSGANLVHRERDMISSKGIGRYSGARLAINKPKIPKSRKSSFSRLLQTRLGSTCPRSRAVVNSMPIEYLPSAFFEQRTTMYSRKADGK